MPSSLTELAQKAAARKIKAAEDAKAKHDRERAAALRERKAFERIKIKQRDLLGETIRDADLTPQEHALIADILSRRPGPEPKDWDVLADWMPVVKPTRPVEVLNQDDVLKDAAE